jgi:hypothetical protein
MNELDKNYLFDAFLVLLAIGPSICSLHIDMTPNEYYWFQRSGSVMVFFSVLLEFNQLKEPLDIGVINSSRFHKYCASVKSLMPYISLILAALGTIIWGYGDIPFLSSGAT